MRSGIDAIRTQVESKLTTSLRDQRSKKGTGVSTNMSTSRSGVEGSHSENTRIPLSRIQLSRIPTSAKASMETGRVAVTLSPKANAWHLEPQVGRDLQLVQHPRSIADTHATPLQLRQRRRNGRRCCSALQKWARKGQDLEASRAPGCAEERATRRSDGDEFVSQRSC